MTPCVFSISWSRHHAGCPSGRVRPSGHAPQPRPPLSSPSPRPSESGGRGLELLQHEEVSLGQPGDGGQRWDQHPGLQEEQQPHPGLRQTQGMNNDVWRLMCTANHTDMTDWTHEYMFVCLFEVFKPQGFSISIPKIMFS